MVNRLNGLVSSKARKTIIINGKLVTVDGRILTARRENYRTVLSTVGAGKEETIVDNGDEILSQFADNFNKKYTAIATGDAEELQQFRANVDPFTGSIVMKNGLYDRLFDRNNELHIHDGVIQLLPDVRKEVREFSCSLILDYFEIYHVLLNRRLMSSHIPMTIKGHLVAGLFQPLVVKTKQIDCPLELAEFDWLHEYLREPESVEKILEGVQETSRGLGLTAIAMSDFADKFGTPIVTELNRLYFQYILYYILINTFDATGYERMEKRFSRIASSIQDGRGDAQGVGAFMDKTIEGLGQARTEVLRNRR